MIITCSDSAVLVFLQIAIASVDMILCRNTLEIVSAGSDAILKVACVYISKVATGSVNVTLDVADTSSNSHFPRFADTS